MTQVKPKVIFVGDERVGEFLKIRKPEWEFQPFVKDIMSFWHGLDSGEIDNQAEVVLVLDIFFDPSGENDALEAMVSALAPHCFVGVINYQPVHKELMQNRIDTHLSALSESDAGFYFIDAKKATATLDIAIKKYVSTSNNHQVSAILSGREYSEPVAEVNTRVETQDPIEQEWNTDFSNDNETSDRLGQVVAVTSSKGGSGKSTVALSLATFLAHSSEASVRDGLEERALKVCVLDLDVRDGQIGFLTNVSKPTVIQLRVDGLSRENIERTVIHSTRLKVDLLLAPKRPRTSEDTPPDFYVELIHNLRKMYDYVILDTSVNYLDALLEKVAYPTADQIVFVTDIVVNSILSMARWVHEVTGPKERGGMGISKKKIGIVVNKALANVNMSGNKIIQSAQGIPIIVAIPSNPKLVAHAANMRSMEVLLRHKDLYPAIRRLGRAVVGERYKLSDNITQ